MRKILLLSLLLLCGSLTASAWALTATGTEVARQDSFPVPKGIKNMLFYVQRDPNANTVIYELNQNAQGVLNEKEPVKVYWIRYADGGERRELNYVQRKFAYGVNTKKLAPDKYEVKFVSYDKMAFLLQKGADDKYHVYATINGKEAMLDRVYVRVEGGTFWVPNVLYVEMKGREAATGKAVKGRFKP